ncbi:MAG TPA: alpha/beta hydrolase fold domain-containing protein [Candidatus Binatia bacterium]|nr:alpha/beta hydrolase fold domain-containing protein [Candidatus Binatia bacterium]
MPHHTTRSPAVTFAPDGTATIVALEVPIPPSISAEAQQMLRAAAAAGDPTQGLTASVQELRAIYAAQLEQLTRGLLQTHPVEVERKTMAGVPVALVTPTQTSPHAAGRLLINVHSGAFIRGAGSIVEAIQMAHRTGLPAVAIDYRLAPEHPYPAAVDDTVAVYRELLKTYEPRHIALYGSSAGAVLTAQASVRARQLGLPLPAALGFFSGTADFSRPGDTEAFFSLGGLAPVVAPVAMQARAYLAGNSLTDPVMSPLFADLEGFSPTLLMTGTRDFFLSATANFHRALLRAGVPAELVVFDAMPHEHWMQPGVPEAEEALDLQARFLAEHVRAAVTPAMDSRRRPER